MMMSANTAMRDRLIKQLEVVLKFLRGKRVVVCVEVLECDVVMIRQNPNRKHGEPQNKEPYTVSKVNDNGTVQLRKDATTGGAVLQTWNIRNLIPRKV